VLTRRAVLGVLGLGALAACGDDRPSQPDRPADSDSRPRVERLDYGDDPAQYAILHRPDGDSRGVAVVIHGGAWQAEYDASLGDPLARRLAAESWTAYNLEYRRVGNGGGLPATFDDVAAGIDALADIDGLDLSTVVTIGHSSGGHLATWAAARGRFEAWQPERVPVTAVVAQAGVLDLRQAYADRVGNGAVEVFLGRPPTGDDSAVDPAQQLPLDVPVWCVHGRADDIVPLSQSADYVKRATAAGAQAELVEVEGDHFVMLDPDSEAWDRTLAILDSL
jgi:acetyl esterase/lipase